MLREARKKTGISMHAVARELGLSAPYLCDVELNRRAPLSEERIHVVAVFLGVDAAPLIEASVWTRRQVCLPVADGSPRDRLALRLSDAWGSLSEDQIRAIESIVGKAA